MGPDHQIGNLAVEERQTVIDKICFAALYINMQQINLVITITQFRQSKDRQLLV
jgi:hypothetical protein